METTEIQGGKKSWLTKERGVWLVLCLVLFLAALGLLIWTLSSCLAAPRFTDFPGVTNKEEVSLGGVARPNLGVVLFDKDGKAAAVAETDENGNFVFENVALADGENKFTARVLDAEKKSSKPSEEIVVRRDANAPDLEVSLAEGGSTSEKEYAMTGKAEPGSTVVVNGVTAEVGEDGSWSATIDLSQGVNSLTVTATDAEGNESQTTTEVTYIPPPEEATGEEANVNEEGAGEETNVNEEATGEETPEGGTEEPGEEPTNTNTAPPPPEPVTFITVTASVSNPTPNIKSNETINATVKDSDGNPITDARVRAVAHYKAGDISYDLNHLGGGQYSVSFKVGTGSESGYKVLVDVTATSGGMAASIQTSFTPR